MDKDRPIVFISYSSQDSVFADLINFKLNAANVDVWMDQDKINAGEEWRSEIDLGIVHADALVHIITTDSCNSSYVTYEWAFAIGREKKIIPLLYKSADIHPRTRDLQYLDFTNQRKGPGDQLFIIIKEAHGVNDFSHKKSNLVGNMTVEDGKIKVVPSPSIIRLISLLTLAR